ncbi:hypothetical protein ACOSQ2_028602 [Xanthoceras sorbifolium]
MSSLGDQRRHKADIGGPSNARDRRSRLCDDVLVEMIEARLRGLLLQVPRRPGVIRGSPLRSLPQGIMARVRILYLEPRGCTIPPWLFLRSCKCGLGVHCPPPL